MRVPNPPAKMTAFIAQLVVMVLLQMGALGLMLLLLSGVANVAATAPPDHRRFIARIELLRVMPISLMQKGAEAIVRNPI